MAMFYTTNTNRPVMISDEDAEAVSDYLWFEKQSSYRTYVATSVRIGRRVVTVRLHRFIAGRMGLSVRMTQDVHHTDYDTFNNYRTNLEVIGRSEHRALHNNIGR